MNARTYLLVGQQRRRGGVACINREDWREEIRRKRMTDNKVQKVWVKIRAAVKNLVNCYRTCRRLNLIRTPPPLFSIFSLIAMWLRNISMTGSVSPPRGVFGKGGIGRSVGDRRRPPAATWCSLTLPFLSLQPTIYSSNVGLAWRGLGIWPYFHLVLRICRLTSEYIMEKVYCNQSSDYPQVTYKIRNELRQPTLWVRETEAV